jgi:hypothetical protein
MLDEHPSRVENLLESHRYGRLSHQEFANRLRTLSDCELKRMNKLVLESLGMGQPECPNPAVP